MTINTPQELIKEAKKTPENFYVIHYSCQNLNDDNELLSPRITSIAVSHFGTDQTISFSAYIVAQILHIEKADIPWKLDSIEFELLKDFYAFVRDRRDKYWIHWNMRNSVYGFEHLEIRYRALGGRDASIIPVERRLNLNDFIAKRYGANYAKHPKLKNLWELNGGLHRDFLEGKDEVRAFTDQQFIKLHKSTLCKVGAFGMFLRRMISGKLRTASHGFGILLDRLFESRIVKGIGLVATVVGLAPTIWAASHVLPWAIHLAESRAEHTPLSQR